MVVIVEYVCFAHGGDVRVCDYMSAAVAWSNLAMYAAIVFLFFIFFNDSGS